MGYLLLKVYQYILQFVSVFMIFAQALVNTQFAIGLGEGLGYVFSYLVYYVWILINSLSECASL